MLVFGFLYIICEFAAHKGNFVSAEGVILAGVVCSTIKTIPAQIFPAAKNNNSCLEFY